MDFNEGDMVNTPKGLGVLIKRMGTRVRVQLSSDESFVWVEYKDLKHLDANVVQVSVHSIAQQDAAWCMVQASAVCEEPGGRSHSVGPASCLHPLCVPLPRRSHGG